MSDGRWQWNRGNANVVFTSRVDGNLAQHVGDDPAAVVQRRMTTARAIGLDADHIACVTQVHGADVWVDLESEGSEVAADMRWSSTSMPDVRADALVTSRAGVGLAVGVADCMPVAIVLGDAIAAVHVGWRSLALGILESTLLTLKRVAGSSAALANAGPYAVIGPSLGPCCMEIGEDVAIKFAPSSIVRRSAGAPPHLDARAEARQRLEHRGVRVDVIDVCTKCEPQLFSHRASQSGGRPIGRQAMLVRRTAAD